MFHTIRLNIIDIYMAKAFISRLLLLLGIIASFILLIESVEMIETVNDRGVALSTASQIVIFRTFQWIQNIVPFAVMIAALITLRSLTNHSEIAVMKAGGISSLQLLRPIIISAFIFGVFMTAIANPVISIMINRYNKLEENYDIYLKENRMRTIAKQGIWLKQRDLGEGSNGEIIIRSSKIDQDSMTLKNIIMIFSDENLNFTKRIDAKKALFIEKEAWYLSGATVNSDNELNRYYDKLTIPTNLRSKFILDKIDEKFTTADAISFWKLPFFINNLEKSGFPSAKFRVQFHNLLTMPLLFVAMVIMSIFFITEENRSAKKTLMLGVGVIFSFLIYFTSNIMITFGVAGKIPIYSAIWIPIIIYFLTALLMLTLKEDG